MTRWQPLDRLDSLKLKLSAIIVGAIGIAAFVSVLGFRLGWPVWIRPMISAAIGVAIMWVFAGGIISPLRVMATAAARMASGDYDTRVPATSRDEVGDLARAFNTMSTRLAEVDQERRDLIAMVSHELRTPITALQANLENLVDGVGSDPATPSPTGAGRTAVDDVMLDTMLRQTERLGRLVAQLLDLSRLESGTVPLSEGEVVVGSLVAAVNAEAELQHPDLDLRVEVNPPELVVPGDRERLHQSLSNLVDNAARFTPAGEPVVLRAHRRRNAVRIEVEDRGPGIPTADVDRVFRRWERGAASRHADTGGSGLGLAIARWVVELHGGEITAETAEPTGCRIVVDLPAESPRRGPT